MKNIAKKLEHSQDYFIDLKSIPYYINIISTLWSGPPFSVIRMGKSLLLILLFGYGKKETSFVNVASETNRRVMKNRLKSFKYLMCLYLYWHEFHIYLFIFFGEKGGKVATTRKFNMISTADKSLGQATNN